MSAPSDSSPRASRQHQHSLSSIGSYGQTPPRPRPPLRPGHALRRAFAKGYGWADVRADLLAGLVVGVVALPLSMALAIAVGAPPQLGLYTAIVGGFVTAVLGGCKFQVTGPTAAFVVVLAPIVSKHGIAGLLTAGCMAGFILIGMGLARLGTLIRYVPYPVTTGFTSGIGAVIAVLQIKDVLGLSVASMPEHFVDKVEALWEARGTARLAELVVAAATLTLLLVVPRVLKRVPAPLLAIGAVSLGVIAAHWIAPSFSVATIGSRFHTQIGGVDVAGIPSILPRPSLPWGDALSFRLIRDLFPGAVAIALLGAIESLLSGVVADGMTGTKHEPNAELLALGVGNVLAPIFGGIAATGALARTATNIRAGARSPVAAMTHSVAVLLAIVLLAPLVAYVPMASLAALLLLVAWNMSEAPRFVRLAKLAPKSDVFVLFTCFLLTILFDMVIAISVGFMAAAILFMRRMAECTESKLVLDRTEEGGRPELPPGVRFYEVNGPLFFGAAESAMEALHAARGDDFRVLVLHLGKVPVVDATGFAALESAIETLLARKKTVVIAGPLPRPQRIFEKARFHDRSPFLLLAPDLDAALDQAADIAASGAAPAAAE